VPSRPRRPLSSAISPGPADQRGDPKISALLATALDAPTHAPDDDLTHGFHAYPARMHPAIARSLVASFRPRDELVLDPFCGSGTVVLEAYLAGRPAVGVDLNPLALRIAEVKTDRRVAASRARFLERVTAAATASEARVRARVAVRAPLSPAEARWYDPHVLKELAGLREEIVACTEERDRRAMEVVLSSIVVKFSRQRADTDEREVQKRIRKGLVTEFFVRKANELVERWEALEASLPPDARPPRLVLGDALELRRVLGKRLRTDLIISSPPYGGTYDYDRHHARRLPWLGLDASELTRREIGARRRLGEAPDAAARWDAELRAMLASMQRLVREGGLVVLLVGDGEVGGKRVEAADQLRELAAFGGMEAVAAASQPRPDWRGKSPRLEHLVALRVR